LIITEETFNKVLSRVSDAERAIRESSPDDEIDAVATLFRRIELDCAAVFENLKIFRPGGPLYNDLVKITKAFSLYRSNFRYIQGSHAVAAAFLINLSPSISFIALANSLNRPLPLAFLSGDGMAVRILLESS
jgi:Rab-GTPase-TBC domain